MRHVCEGESAILPCAARGIEGYVAPELCIREAGEGQVLRRGAGGDVGLGVGDGGEGAGPGGEEGEERGDGGFDGGCASVSCHDEMRMYGLRTSEGLAVGGRGVEVEFAVFEGARGDEEGGFVVEGGGEGEVGERGYV